MDSLKKRNAWYLLFLWCFGASTFAASKTIAPVTAKLASMVASPNSCTVETDQDVCEMTFHILWQTPKKGDYCLHSKEGVKPLKCWYKRDHGTIKLEFFASVLADSEHYVLLDAQGDRLIASVDIPIIGTLKQRQRAQRRRRGFWRMF